MAPKIERPHFTAEQWLATPRLGRLGNVLEKQEKHFTSHASTAEISSVLYAKGSDPRNNFLLPGEYARLVSLLESRYPNLFGLWIDQQIAELEQQKYLGETGSTYYLEYKAPYYKELKQAFQRHEKYPVFQAWIQWV